MLVDERDALSTYRYLRILMPIMVVLLAIAVVDQIVRGSEDCWLGSISAYYYTPVRAIFVAALCTMGACLIVYQGDSNKEDFLLNVAGSLAFVVALVPTPLKSLVINPATKSPVTSEPICRRSNVPSETQLTDALQNNILALLVAFTTGLVIVWIFRYVAARRAGRVGFGALVFGTVATTLLGFGLATFWIIYKVSPELLRSKAHVVAAVGMFACIVAVVGLNWRAAPGCSRLWYLGCFAAMCVATVSGIVLALTQVFDHTVFWLEAALIVLFGIFWIVQTVELWDRRTRSRTVES